MPGTEGRLKTMLDNPIQRKKFWEEIKEAYWKLGFRDEELTEAVELTLKKLSSHPTVESGVSRR